MRRLAWQRWVLLSGLVVVFESVCGSGFNEFDMTVINAIQSTDAVRVDLGGDVRGLNLGDGTVFRSVKKGQHILSIEGATCAGVTRDTLSVNGDVTVRLIVTHDSVSGVCLVQSSVSLTTLTKPAVTAPASSF